MSEDRPQPGEAWRYTYGAFAVEGVVSKVLADGDVIFAGYPVMVAIYSGGTWERVADTAVPAYEAGRAYQDADGNVAIWNHHQEFRDLDGDVYTPSGSPTLLVVEGRDGKALREAYAIATHNGFVTASRMRAVAEWLAEEVTS